MNRAREMITTAATKKKPIRIVLCLFLNSTEILFLYLTAMLKVKINPYKDPITSKLNRKTNGRGITEPGMLMLKKEKFGGVASTVPSQIRNFPSPPAKILA